MLPACSPLDAAIKCFVVNVFGGCWKILGVVKGRNLQLWRSPLLCSEGYHCLVCHVVKAIVGRCQLSGYCGFRVDFSLLFVFFIYLLCVCACVRVCVCVFSLLRVLIQQECRGWHVPLVGFGSLPNSELARVASSCPLENLKFRRLSS